MRALQTLCVFLVLLICVSASDNQGNDDLKHRLATIEATLKLMVEKNEQFENRIAKLESDNSHLKTYVKELQDYIQVDQKNNCDKETNEEKDKSKIIKLVGQSSRNVIKMSKPATPELKRQGRLTILPKTVAFTAQAKRYLTNLGAGQTLIFDYIFTNVGGAYHGATGIFTAPYSGVYVFNFALMIDKGNYEFTELVKNGNRVLPNLSHARDTHHYVSTSRTTTIALQAGDEVWVRTMQSKEHGDGEIHGDGYSTFSGWMICLTE